LAKWLDNDIDVFLAIRHGNLLYSRVGGVAGCLDQASVTYLVG
jgi:hypothetical protein